MQHGLFLPPIGELAHPAVLADVARTAEAAGWDGFFLWDHVYYRAPVESITDPWIALAAVAIATERILIGPLVTPLPRRRPQIVARQVAALDLLSNGRVVLGAGLGLDTSGGELSRFGEQLDDRVRAEMLDEALDLVALLLTGELVDHGGRHYSARDVRFRPTPVRRPRPPIWLAARWPHRAPLRRAARYEGVFLIDLDSPDQLREAVAYARDERDGAGGFDIAVQGAPGEDARPWVEAGATWWLTRWDPFTVTVAAVQRVAAQPPAS